MVTTTEQQTVVRTSRGLSVAGTRITLYAILDYLRADWPPKLIQDWLDLSDTQMSDVLTYIAAHQTEVEQEYQQVIDQSEELRDHWDAQLQQHLAQQSSSSITPEQAALRARFQAWKAQRNSA